MKLSESGLTSWGCPWTWNFGSPSELHDPEGVVLLATDFHTLEPEYNFENKRLDPRFVMSDDQAREWDDICWKCYRMEFTIYGMVQKGFRACAGPFVQNYIISHPNKDWLHTWMPDSDFRVMLSACLKSIRAQWDWSSDDKDWLFTDDGPVTAAVEEWLTAMLQYEGFELE